MSDSGTRPFRSIIKDGQTYDEDYRSTDVEISAWVIKRAAVDIDATASGSLILKVDGELQYDTILEVVLGRRQVEGYDPRSAQELADRTESNSYADDRGGRSASTIRGYLSNDTLERLPSSHPVKRVLRREIRTYDLGHFAEQETTTAGDLPQPIDMAALRRAYKFARKITGDSGLGFVSEQPFSEAIEDNKLISEQEIRPADRPTGDFKASVHVMKNSPSGSELETYEYEVDFDGEKLISNDGYGPPV
jgi:hypothetical protein